MRHLLCFSLIFLSSMIIAQEETTTKKTMMTSSSVTLVTSWSDKAILKPDAFVEKTFEVLAEEYYIEKLDKIFEEVISEKKDKKRKSTTIVKKVYFFAKSTISHYPEALVTFSVTTVNYDEELIKNPKVKVFPSVIIKLDSPFKLYTDYFDFAMDKFDISSIQLLISAKCTGSQWSIQQNFSLKNLFLISWLSSVKRTLRIFEEPKVHPTLLFFKQRFDHLGNQLYDNLK